MKNSNIRLLILITAVGVLGVVIYLAFPEGGLAASIVGGVIGGFLTSAYIIDRIEKLNPKFAQEGQEDRIYQAAEIARGRMEQDGSFFTTPMHSWSIYPRLMMILFLILIYIIFVVVYVSQREMAVQTYPYSLVLGVLALVTILIMSMVINLVKSWRNPKRSSANKQVTFYEDHLLFLPTNEAVPYGDIEYIDYESRGRSSRGIQLNTLLIRYQGENHVFEWLEGLWLTGYGPWGSPFDLAILSYLGFEETDNPNLIRAAFDPGIRYCQRYIYNPKLVPTKDLDPDKLKAAKDSNQLMLLIFFLIIFAFLLIDLLQDWRGY